MTDLEEDPEPTPEYVPVTPTGRKRPNWRDAARFQRERDAAREALASTQAELTQVHEALEDAAAENATLRLQNANQADLRHALTDEHPVVTVPRSDVRLVNALIYIVGISALTFALGYTAGAK